MDPLPFLQTLFISFSIERGDGDGQQEEGSKKEEEWNAQHKDGWNHKGDYHNHEDAS